MSFKRLSPLNMTYYDSALYFFNEPYVGSDAVGKLEIIDLDAPLSDSFSEKKAWSAFLGEKGWVVSPFIKIRRGIHPWHWAAKRNRYSLIEQFFTEQKEEILSSIVGYINTNIACEKSEHFFEAYENYQSKRYTSCAMMLVSLFEGCIRECPIARWQRKIIPFYQEAIQEKLVAKDSLNNRFIGQIMLKNDVHSMYLPSLDSFITRLFINGDYKFENGNEPPYLNRNWLMHGMMKRDVKKHECLQMFSALFTLLFVKTYLVDDSPYDN